MKVKHNSKALKQQASKKDTSFIWLGTYIIIAAIALTFFILFRLHIFDLLGKYRALLQKLSLAVFFGVIILSVAKFIEISIRKRSNKRFQRYNLIHLTRLLSIIAVTILAISFLFANWYAAAVSLGLISLIVGFALQTPISSFIGWIYIIIRNPYRIGDRIQLDTFKGRCNRNWLYRHYPLGICRRLPY